MKYIPPMRKPQTRQREEVEEDQQEEDQEEPQSKTDMGYKDVDREEQEQRPRSRPVKKYSQPEPKGDGDEDDFDNYGKEKVELGISNRLAKETIVSFLEGADFTVTIGASDLAKIIRKLG